MRRRELLAGLAALGVGRRAWAAGVLGGRPRAEPEFGRLAERGPSWVVGVRPHRTGGVRLELEPAPIQTADGPRFVVHDYGHGGAGLTLAFGCAAVVADRVEAEVLPALRRAGQEPRIVVVGVGIAGLTAATELRARFPTASLEVHARDLDVRRTTSYLAGGQFEPSGVWKDYLTPEGKEVLGDLLRRSRDRLVPLLADPGSGVLARDNFALDHELTAVDRLTPPDVIAPAERGLLPFPHLRGPGRLHHTWLANPTLLLPRLRADLEVKGVSFVEDHVADRAAFERLPGNVLVNCAGLGAGALANDDALVPQRGHYVRLARTDEAQDWLFSGGCANRANTYVFCRQDDVVVGGTIVKGDGRAEVLPEDDVVFRRVHANAAALFAGSPGSCIVGE